MLTLVRRWWLAAMGVVLLALITAVVVLATGVILLPVHTPGSKPVSLTVVSRTGPIAAGHVEILAATSVDDLRALASAAILGGQGSCQPVGCWSSVTIARPSLVIALSAPAPCHNSALNADVGPGALLTIHEVVGGWECGPGAGALAVPSYWLLGVPLDVLPRNVLTVAFDGTAAGLGALGGRPVNLDSGSTTVDLRPPLPGPADRVTSAAELRAAVQTAQRDGYSRLGSSQLSLIGLALRRWPKADRGCGSGESQVELAWGSLVVFAADSLVYEYHELGGQTDFCRSAARRLP